MNTTKFAEVISRRGCKPLDPIKTVHGRILIGDGFVKWHKEFQKPHYLTIWAIDRDGVDSVRPLYCSRFSSRPARIKAAVDDAQDWIKDNIEGGRF